MTTHRVYKVRFAGLLYCIDLFLPPTWGNLINLGYDNHNGEAPLAHPGHLAQVILGGADLPVHQTQDHRQLLTLGEIVEHAQVPAFALLL